MSQCSCHYTPKMMWWTAKKCKILPIPRLPSLCSQNHVLINKKFKFVSVAWLPSPCSHPYTPKIIWSTQKLQNCINTINPNPISVIPILLSKHSHPNTPKWCNQEHQIYKHVPIRMLPSLCSQNHLASVLMLPCRLPWKILSFESYILGKKKNPQPHAPIHRLPVPTIQT